MYWVRLYVLENDRGCFLAYGYATQEHGTPQPWRRSESHREGNRWRLRRYDRYFTTDEIAAWCANLGTDVVVLSTDRGEVHLSTGGLRRRPTVYALPNGQAADGVPHSLTAQLAAADTYWCLSKAERLGVMFFTQDRSDAIVRQEAIDSAGKLLSVLGTELPIDFLGEEAGRFGNFEVIRYLAGSHAEPDGLRCSLVPQSPTQSLSTLSVWLEPPLGDLPGSFFINARLFNGSGPRLRTVILDELRPWSPGQTIRFQAEEPLSEWEVSVWRDYRLVARERQILVRSAMVNITVSGRETRVQTPWSQRLPPPLREAAERVDTSVRMNHEVHARGMDPWRDAEGEMKQWVETWFPPPGEGRFYPPGLDSHVSALSFLAERIAQSDVSRATIVDPYFDEVVVEHLLARMTNVSGLRVFTSRERSLPTTAPWWRRVVSSLRKLFRFREKLDAPTRIKAACEHFREALPGNLEIFNVETRGSGRSAAGYQFHDRFVLVEKTDPHGGTICEVWMLGTSLNACAMAEPLVITRLPGALAGQVQQYVETFATGQVPGHHEASSHLLWTNRGVPRRPMVQDPPGPGGLRLFPGWELILEALVPDASDPFARVETALARGLLESEVQRPDQATWCVPEVRCSAAAAAVLQPAASAPARLVERLDAAANWMYRGGPPPICYRFEPQHLSGLAASLTAHLQTHQRTGSRQQTFTPLVESRTMAESLDAVWTKLNHFAWPELPVGLRPIVSFHADALWRDDPARLVRLLEQTRSTDVFDWLVLEGGSATDETRARLFLTSSLGALQALGVGLLYRLVDRPAPTADPVPTVIGQLATTSLSATEKLLAGMFLCARTHMVVARSDNPFARGVSLWPTGGIVEADCESILWVIKDTTRGLAVRLTAELGQVCPDPANARFFDAWCVGEIRRQLPSRGAVMTDAAARSLDEPTLQKTAECALRLHGSQTPQWCGRDLLGTLPFRSMRQRLLRVHHYGEWFDRLEGFLAALQFAVAIVEGASVADRRNALTSLVPVVASAIEQMGTEIWQYSHDFHGRLYQVAQFLSRSIVDLTGPDAQIIESMFSNSAIPSAWRVAMLLASEEVATTNEALLLDLVRNLGLPNYADSAREIDGWLNKLLLSTTELSSHGGDGLPLAAAVTSALENWRNERTGGTR